MSRVISRNIGFFIKILKLIIYSRCSSKMLQEILIVYGARLGSRFELDIHESVGHGGKKKNGRASYHCDTRKYYRAVWYSVTKKSYLFLELDLMFQ